MTERLRCWTAWSEDGTGVLVPSIEPTESPNITPKNTDKIIQTPHIMNTNMINTLTKKANEPYTVLSSESLDSV